LIVEGGVLSKHGIELVFVDMNWLVLLVAMVRVEVAVGCVFLRESAQTFDVKVGKGFMVDV